MFKFFLKNVIKIFQVIFGYIFLSAFLGILVKIITFENFDLPINILLLIVWSFIRVYPSPQSLYPFAFQMVLRFQRNFD